jgi:hypothetical protein
MAGLSSPAAADPDRSAPARRGTAFPGRVSAEPSNSFSVTGIILLYQIKAGVTPAEAVRCRHATSATFQVQSDDGLMLRLVSGRVA